MWSVSEIDTAFLSTPSSRRETDNISIHALREEGDARRAQCQSHQ